MDDLIRENIERCEALGAYLIENASTVRATAAHFNISKSTVHKDINERLGKVNSSMYKNVRAVLEKNKAERHIRGGEATRLKYIIAKSEVSQRSCDNFDKII